MVDAAPQSAEGSEGRPTYGSSQASRRAGSNTTATTTLVATTLVIE
eukprot:CAMPEP_0177763686 /NCGR_PEP_ID=MMETSP0491_2-20121128/7000_1 /TAXON_ID=63592 /ORGANISM="Tetraselmis chuii, Strain PLY429" /LENGTH=45 /DNA_ID= /DNA_START= /DNA_END= /DNA_ORIENTATION=